MIACAANRLPLAPIWPFTEICLSHCSHSWPAVLLWCVMHILFFPNLAELSVSNASLRRIHCQWTCWKSERCVDLFDLLAAGKPSFKDCLDLAIVRHTTLFFECFPAGRTACYSQFEHFNNKQTTLAVARSFRVCTCAHTDKTGIS